MCMLHILYIIYHAHKITSHTCAYKIFLIGWDIFIFECSAAHIPAAGGLPKTRETLPLHQTHVRGSCSIGLECIGVRRSVRRSCAECCSCSESGHDGTSEMAAF